MGKSSRGSSPDGVSQFDSRGYLQPGSSSGNAWRGKTDYLGNIPNLTEEQLSVLSQILTQPQDMDAFTKSIVEPSQKIFQEQTIPGVQERFESMGAGSSGALNRALAGAAQDFSSGLAPEYMKFMQQGQQNKLAALGINAFNPMISQTPGLAGPSIGGLSSILGGLLGGRFF